MPYFFSLGSNVPIVTRLTQTELSAIEAVSATNGVHVKIELIEHGAIVYLDETFPAVQLLKFRSIYLHDTQVYDATHLPPAYMTWYDSITKETIYFAAPVQQYLQNKLAARTGLDMIKITIIVHEFFLFMMAHQEDDSIDQFLQN